MKFFLTDLLLLLFNFTQAQNDASILFTKGAELEYQTSTMPLPKKEIKLEITHISLSVTDVRDSNNIVYSYITKKGTGIIKPNSHYEKRYVLKKEDGKLMIPIDLFTVDTFYLADKYVSKDEKGFHTASRLKTSNYYSIDLTKNVFDCSPKSVTTDAAIRYYLHEPMFVWRNDKWEVNHGEVPKSLESMQFSYTTSINCKIGDKASVNTKAGDFDCYKLMITLKMPSAEVTEIMYYTPEFGLIKMESVKREKSSVFVELISVKKNL
jgi:hypothetical protein